MSRTRSTLTALALAGLAAAGCSDDGSSSAGGECAASATGDTAVAVTLDEFTVVAAPGSVAAGRIAFTATNAGNDPHELVIVEGSDPARLPTVTSSEPLENGKVDEGALPAGALVGEIEEFAAGDTCAASYPLEKGTYVLFCNVVERHGGTLHNHFQQGMRTVLTVS